MKKRLIVSALLMSLVLVSVVANVSAITGRLGNSRMVLRLDVGEEARRYLLVQNVNDVPLTIEFVASGDLADDVSFEDNSFVLQPGEEKKSYFTIEASEAGTTETKINVMFKPPQGSGVGLSANIIVVAGGEADEGSVDEGTSEEGSGDEGFNFEPSAPDAQGEEVEGSGVSTIMLLTVSTIVLVVVFIVLLLYSGKLSQKKRSRRPRE